MWKKLLQGGEKGGGGLLSDLLRRSFRSAANLTPRPASRKKKLYCVAGGQLVRLVARTRRQIYRLRCALNGAWRQRGLTCAYTYTYVRILDSQLDKTYTTHCY